MRKLPLIALIGLGAQLVDGALGMAYGATSTCLLLSAGLAPAVVSATVHLAEIGTTAASGAAHWRFKNVDWRIVAIWPCPARSAASPARCAELAVRRVGRAGDGGRAGRARPLRAAALLGARRPARAPRRQPAAAARLPRAARRVRRLHGRRGRRRLGPDLHAGAALDRAGWSRAR